MNPELFEKLTHAERMAWIEHKRQQHQAIAQVATVGLITLISIFGG